MNVKNNNGTPKIIDVLIVQGIQYPDGFLKIEGYKSLEAYYATMGDYKKAAMYRDHQIKRIKNTIT